LDFDSDISKEVISGFTGIDKATIIALCKDKQGSIFIEQFIDSKVKDDHKISFFETLEGHFGEIALDSFGSHCIEKLYKYSDLNHKQRITEELIKISEQLINEKHGGFVVKCCKLDLFGFSKESWIRAEEKEKRKKEIFEEFLVENKVSLRERC